MAWNDIAVGVVTAPFVVPAALIGGGTRQLLGEEDAINKTFDGWGRLFTGAPNPRTGQYETLGQRFQYANSQADEAVKAPFQLLARGTGYLGSTVGEAAGNGLRGAFEGLFKGLGTKLAIAGVVVAGVVVAVAVASREGGSA